MARDAITFMEQMEMRVRVRSAPQGYELLAVASLCFWLIEICAQVSHDVDSRYAGAAQSRNFCTVSIRRGRGRCFAKRDRAIATAYRHCDGLFWECLGTVSNQCLLMKLCCA